MKILNIAHRGYSGKFDENTMLAFKKAIEYGADGIETDVQLSKNGVPVIMHDETLDRTTDGTGFLKNYAFEELKKFKTKSVGSAALRKKELKQNYNSEEIPSLKELLELVASSDLKVLNLELKNSILEYEGMEEKVLDMIEEYGLKDRIIISSFNHMSLVKIRKMDKDIILGALTDSTLANVPKYLNDIGVQCYHPFFPSILNKDYNKEIREAGIKINPYTVNTEEEMKMVVEAGTDSIITNEVELFNRIVQK